MSFVSYPASTSTELPEAAHEQRRSNQQDERRSGLHDHQRIARETPAADDASAGLLEAAQPRAREAEGGQQAERARRQNRDARREEQRRADPGARSASPGMGAPPKPPATASGAARTRSGTPAHAMSAPAAPPAAASSSASVTCERTRSPRPAPSARRTARSRRRFSARTVNRLATFAHAIRKTMPTVPSRIHSAVEIAADQLLAERLHHRPVTLHDPHVRRGAAQPLLHATRERLELRHQRCAVRSRLHARHRARPEPAGRDLRGANRQRHPERDALIGEAELRLHDADHRRGSGPRSCSSCRSPSASEPNQVCHSQWLMTTTLAVVLIGRQPPVQGLHAERREERRRRLRHEELVDLPFRACRRRTGAVEPDVFDAGHALAVFEVQLIRNAELLGLIRPGSRACRCGPAGPRSGTAAARGARR